METLPDAYTAGAFVAAVCGILGYFDIAGLGERSLRPCGPRLGHLQGSERARLLSGSADRVSGAKSHARPRAQRASHLAALLVIFLGMFLSFSRGSYGATVIAMRLMIASVYRASRDLKMKRRIVMASAAARGDDRRSDRRCF